MPPSPFTVNDPRLELDAVQHAYSLAGRPLISVTQVLAKAGLADFSAPWFDEFVKDRGTFMHDAIRMDVHGELDHAALDDQLRGYVDGWRAFLSDMKAEVEYSEQMLCDPTQGVAGTLDYIVRWTDNGRTVRTVIDLKRGLYPCVAIQLAAYKEMAAALYDEPVVLRRAALVLTGNGSYALHPDTRPPFHHTDPITWQGALRVIHWRQTHGLIN